MWTRQNDLDSTKFIWTSKFRWVQSVQIIKKIVQKMIRTRQNDLDPTKIIWTVQNHFGPIKGQGIHQLLLELTHRTTFAISIRLLIIFYYFGVGILTTKIERLNEKLKEKKERKADFLSKL